jgi:hypothetical protein
MTIYLIHAHKNLNQLNQLIEILSDSNHKVYVNIDLNSEINCKLISKKAVLIKNRITIRWGDFSQVQATINSLKQINSNEKDYNHIVFLSGQDFPLKRNNEIDAVIQKGKDYMMFTPINENHLWRLRFEIFNYKGGNDILKYIFRKVKVILKLVHYKRKLPYNLKPFGGSQWWILSNESVQYVLDFVNTHVCYNWFFKLVDCSDELFFQTILCNSHRFEFIENNYMRYIDWSENKQSPKVLTELDYRNIVDSNKLFARKMDSPQSKDLIEKLKMQLK